MTITSPMVGVRGIVMSVSVCLYVFLYVCMFISVSAGVS